MSASKIHGLLDGFYTDRNFSYYVDFFLKNETELQALIEISFQTSDEKYCSHGTWVCAHIAEKDNSVFVPLQGKIMHFLQTEKLQSGLRNWMKVLTFVPLKEEYEGEMIDLCVKFIENSSNKVALHVYAMMNLIPLMKKYPEILPEILALLDLHSEGKSPAYHAVFRKFVKSTKIF
ncbi:MAG: hypothetical protein WC044_14495 [Crocinitomicaceae bacterium]